MKFKKFSILVVLVFCISLLTTNTQVFAYDTYANVHLTVDDKYAYTKRIYASGKLKVYVKNTRGYTLLPHKVSYSVTDSNGKVIVEGDLDALKEVNITKNVKSGTYSLSLSNYLNASGYGALWDN